RREVLFIHRFAAHVFFAEDDELARLGEEIGHHRSPRIAEIEASAPSGFILELRDGDRIAQTAARVLRGERAREQQGTCNNDQCVLEELHWFLRNLNILSSLHDHGDSLAAANASGGQSVALLPSPQLVENSEQKARAGCA